MDGTLNKLPTLLTILGTLALVYWPPVYHAGVLIPIRYELFFVIAATLYGITLIKQYRAKQIQLYKDEKKIYLALAAVVISIIFATTMAYFKYDLRLNFIGITIFLKILLGIAVFTLVYRSATKNVSFYKAIAWAFILPSTLLIPFIFMPALAAQLGFISDGYRFQGPTDNPVAMSMLLMIAFAYFSALSIHQLAFKKVKYPILFYAIATLGLLSLMLWGQSRSCLIASLMIVMFTVISYDLQLKTSFLKLLMHLFITSCCIFLLVMCAFWLIPKEAKMFLLGRIAGATSAQIQGIALTETPLTAGIEVSPTPSNTLPMTTHSSITIKPMVFPKITLNKILAAAHKVRNSTHNYIAEDGISLALTTEELHVYINQEASKIEADNVSLNQISSTLKKDPRKENWKYYYHLSIKNPFGLGVNYYPRFAFKWINPPPSNDVSFLTPFLLFNLTIWGGFITLLGMCYLLGQALLKAKNTMMTESINHLTPYKIASITSLLAFWFIAIFNGLNLDYMGFWIIFALALI